MKTWQRVVLSACSTLYLNRPQEAERFISLISELREQENSTSKAHREVL